MLTLTASIKINVVFDFEYKWASQQDNMPLHCLWIIKSHASTHTHKIYILFNSFCFRAFSFSHTLRRSVSSQSLIYIIFYFLKQQTRGTKKNRHTQKTIIIINTYVYTMLKYNSLYFTASFLISALPSFTSRIDSVMIESRMK